MAFSTKIIDLYLSLDRQLVPELNQIPVKGHKKNRKYSRAELLKYAKKGYNFGWILGRQDIVVDVDPRHGGDKSLRKLCKHLDIKDLADHYPTVKTGGGGFHYYMRLPKKYDPKQFKKEIKKLPGIEVLREGNKVTIAGSVHHKTAKRYKVDKYSPFRAKPKFIKKGVVDIYYRKPEKVSAKNTLDSKRLYTLLQKLPVEDYRNHQDWLNVMMASHSATKGKGLKGFLKWSLSDPEYKGDKAVISQRWQSLTPNDGITVKTLMKEVRRYESPVDDVEREIAKQLLANRFEKGAHLVHGADQRYWKYTGTHWELYAPNMVKKHLLEQIEAYKTEFPDTKKSVATLLNNTGPILEAMSASELNLNEQSSLCRSIVNTKNFEIWIDETSGCVELKKHRVESKLTYCLDVQYDPKAKCKRFDKALRQIFAKNPDKEDLIRHYWELMGYMIQNKKNIPVWILFHGSGRNGKKVLMQVPAALLGRSVSSKSIMELNIRQNTHALASLPGKLAIIDDDVDSNAVLPDGMLKRLTENKSLSANPKGGAEFEFVSTALVVMAANNWPRTKDLSDGMRRRAMVFHLKRKFNDANSDLDLVDKIKSNEMAGVLNRCLEGFKRLRERGHFLVPQSCKTASEMWFSSSSQVHQFIEANLVKATRRRIPFKDLYERYKVWGYDMGLRLYSFHYFKKLLGDLNFKIKKSTGNKLYFYDYALTKED